MLTAHELTRRLLASGIALPGEVQGCSDEDIKRIETAFGYRLPASYQSLLRTIGRGAGRLMHECDFTCDTLVITNQVAREIVADAEDAQLTLQDNAFVWSMRYNEQFVFFHCTEGDDDPSVHFYYWESHAFTKVAASVWEFVEGELTGLEEIYRRIPGGPFRRNW